LSLTGVVIKVVDMATRLAPGALARVQEFVNTNDVEGGADDLRDADTLRTWLSERALLAPHEPVTESDLARAAEAREALRALLFANNGEPLDGGAVAALNAASRNARLLVRFDDEGHSYLDPDASGVDGALGRLLAIVYASMQEGTWDRLKACRSETCMWAYYDHSKNRSKAWCSMAVCGNRAKARTYRERHRETVH
jgi:predicted RNA-binding Zn ribbon-like protein